MMAWTDPRNVRASSSVDGPFGSMVFMARIQDRFA